MVEQFDPRDLDWKPLPLRRDIAAAEFAESSHDEVRK